MGLAILSIAAMSTSKNRQIKSTQPSERSPHTTTLMITRNDGPMN
jgi:hypothetical protein